MEIIIMEGRKEKEINKKKLFKLKAFDITMSRT